MKKFKQDFLLLTTNKYVTSECGDITFYNQGTTNCTINGTLVLRPFGSISLNANANELDTTIYQFVFDTNVGQLVVVRKIFI